LYESEERKRKIMGKVGLKKETGMESITGGRNGVRGERERYRKWGR